MTEITHPKLVSTLVKAPLSIQQTLSLFGIDLWHGATGVAGECGELLEALAVEGEIDIENLIEELGDIEFYMEQIRQRTGQERMDVEDICASLEITRDMVVRHAISASIHGSQILDIIKKVAVYNKPCDQEVLGKLADRMVCLDVTLGAIRLSFGIMREQVLAANIKKLMKRYEGLVYSDAAAEQRADKEKELERKFFGKETVEVIKVPHTSDMQDIADAERSAQ